MADIKNWGIWQSSVFKNLKFLFAGAQRIQEVLLISEGGNLSIEHFPMATGFCSLIAKHMSWLVDHRLKHRIKENGHSIIEATERSYIPTDAFHRFTKHDVNSIQPLDDVAYFRYIDKKNSLISGAQEESSIKRNIIYIMLCIIALIVVFSLKK